MKVECFARIRLRSLVRICKGIFCYDLYSNMEFEILKTSFRKKANTFKIKTLQRLFELVIYVDKLQYLKLLLKLW